MKSLPYLLILALASVLFGLIASVGDVKRRGERRRRRRRAGRVA